MEEEKDLEIDWTSLPPEVLNLIVKYLYEIIDFIQFRAVCLAWRFSTPITDLPPQFPWIFDNHYENHERGLRFFSISSNKIYTIHASKSISKCFDGSFDGYYVTRFCSRRIVFGPYSLLNPLNNDGVTLPPCPLNNDGVTLPEWENQPIWAGHGLNQEGKYMVCCAIAYGDFWARVNPESKPKFFFYCVGQEYWCELKLDDGYMFEENVHFYLKGKLFSANVNGVTKVTDIASGIHLYDIPPINGPLTEELLYDAVSFVENSGYVFRVFKHPDNSDNDTFYDIHKLVINNRGFSCWMKVKNVGDYAIIVHYLSGCHVMLKASDLAGIQANCIYVLKMSEEGIIVVEKSNIETNAKEIIRCPFKGSVTWHFPNLHHMFT